MALVGVLVSSGAALVERGGAAPGSAPGGGQAAEPIPASGGSSSLTEVQNTTTTFLNLLGSGYESPSLVSLAGPTPNPSPQYPTVLSGSNLPSNWSGYPSVLELAPDVYSGSPWHLAGLVMGPDQVGLSVSVSSSVTYSEPNGNPSGHGLGDGVEVYLFVNPISTNSWSSSYYYHGDGSQPTVPSQGGVIFPYSSSRYIVVQWDPAYLLSGGNGGGFNLYLVTPYPGNGTVDASRIQSFGPLGEGPAYSVPQRGDLISVSVSYSVETANLQATVTDLAQPQLVDSLSTNVASPSGPSGFFPNYDPHTTYYFGLGGSGNNLAEWGGLSYSVTGLPVPTGSSGVLVETSPSQCGVWVGTSLGSNQYASSNTELATATGSTLYFDAPPTCNVESWDSRAGGFTGTVEQFSGWYVTNGAHANPSANLGLTNLTVAVKGSGTVEANYSVPSNAITYDPGWDGYFGNRTIYPTEDPTPFIIEPQTSGNFSSINYAIPFSNNSVGLTALPGYAYNASAGEFQLYVTTTVDSRVSEPCYYATDDPEFEFLDPDWEWDAACYPIALIDSAESISGVPSTAYTNITGIYGANISAESATTPYWTGYLPKGVNGTSVNLGQWIATAIDLYQLGDDWNDLSDFDEGTEPFILAQEEIGWDAEQLTTDLLRDVGLNGFPFDAVADPVGAMLPFLPVEDAKVISAAENFAISAMFTLLLCEGVIDCAPALVLLAISTILSFFGWYPFGNGVWTPPDFVSQSDTYGDGSINDWAITNDSFWNSSNPGCYAGASPCNASLLSCGGYVSGPYASDSYADSCGNMTYEQGMITETTIPGADLGEVTAGSVQVTGSNELWRFVAPYGSTGPGSGTYDATYSDCDPEWGVSPYCVEPGASTPGISYPVRPAISIWGHSETPSGAPEGAANITLTQTYNGQVTEFTTMSNDSGYWHFFAEPGAVYSYTVTPPDQAASVAEAIPSADTASTQTGSVVTLAPVSYVAATQEVVFSESTLPPGDSWQVWLNSTTGGGDYYGSSIGTEVEVVVPSGVYSWVAEYTGESGGLPFSPAISVPQTLEVVVPFAAYAVTFAESVPHGGTLPPGSPWTVRLTQKTTGSTYSVSSSQTKISIPAVNGTYLYQVSASPGWHITQPPPKQLSGTLTVAGHAVKKFAVKIEQYTYSVTFSDTGSKLGGKRWGIELDGVWKYSTGSSIKFSEPNGTDPFVVQAPSGYTPNPGSGSVTVNGAAASETIGFTKAGAQLTVAVTGLPSQTAWTLDVGGVVNTTTGSSASVGVPDGTVDWAVGNISGYQPATSSGTTAIGGSNVTLNDSYSAVASLYSVTVDPTGLAASVSWGLWVNSTSGGPDSYSSLEGDSGTEFLLPAGSYLWTVLPPAGYSTSEPNGTLAFYSTSMAAMRTISVSFAALYSVTVDAVGLAPGTLWAAWLVPNQTQDSLYVNSTNASVTFEVPDGAYDVWVGSVVGYNNSNWTGTVSVEAASTAINAAYNATSPEYSLTVSESGLAPGTIWEGEVNSTGSGPNATLWATTASMTFTVPNGTYVVTALSMNGYVPLVPVTVTVSGGPLSVAFSYHLTPYSVSFLASGLPSGDSWSVTLGGTQQNSTTGTILFPEPNGTYSWSVTGPAGERPSPASGSLTVAGTPLNRTVTFTAVTYAVTFTESGLPSGANWSVDLGSVVRYSTTSSIVFQVPNGTESYSLGYMGYNATPASGSVTVAGGTVTVHATFSVAKYAITFRETGVPSGHTWSVTLNGTKKSSTAASIVYWELGDLIYYAYTIGAPTGYVSNPTEGSAYLSYAATNISVTFGTPYAVTFSGAGSSDTWSVSVGGATVSQTGGTITFQEPNGTFSYSASAESYSSGGRYCFTDPTNGVGTFTVAGASRSITILYDGSSACTCSSVHADCIDSPALASSSRGVELLAAPRSDP